MSTRQFNPRAIAEFLVLAICTVTCLFTTMGVITALFGLGAAGSRDFVEYWASAHQLLHHADPYSSSAILKLEQSAGHPSDLPALVMGNPPPALPLVLPLGLFGPQIGESLWLLVLSACLVASVQVIRTMHGRPKNLLHVLGLSFAPALICLLTGQVSLFILLGLVLFLRLLRSHPFWAGASLWFCLLKPHLFLPFGAVLLLWIFLTRSYRVLAGTTSALAVSSIVITIIDPLVWTQYVQMMHLQRLDRLLMPSLGPTLRFYISPHTMWLQCLPAALGCVWAIAFYLKRRHEWDWIEDGSILMLVSLFVAPYSFLYDQPVLIPALLHRAYRTHSRTLLSILALSSAVIEIAVLCHLDMYSVFYLWTAPAWVIWYLCAARLGSSSSQRNLSLQGGEGKRKEHSQLSGNAAPVVETAVSHTIGAITIPVKRSCSFDA